MLTIQSKLVFDNNKDKQSILDLMRRWSSCMRYAYNRLLEGETRNEIKRELQGVFGLNSRYVDDAIMKAKSVLESCKGRGKNPSKVIFGGRGLFEKLKKRHINGNAYKRLRQEWQEKRRGNLYSRGDRSKKGNLNTRVEINESGVGLRVNTGERKYIYARIQAGWKRGKNREGLLKAISTSKEPYSVELKLKNGKVYACFTIEESLPEAQVTKENGVIGIDVNAYPSHFAWTEVDRGGQLISYGKIPMPELESGNSNKREYFKWRYAHEIVRIGADRGKAITIERLSIRNKGKRGDFSGRKSRRVKHNFSYKSLLEKVKLLAQRSGIQVIEVNPAYTSVIGMLKYAPQFMISKDVAAAYVIARKSLGLKERIPHNYMELLSSLDVDNLEELKEYVRKVVKNKYLRRRQLKEIDNTIEFLKGSRASLESESGKTLEPLDGTSSSVFGLNHSLWRVLKVAVVTPLSPERVLRNISVLKGLLISGQVGRLKCERKSLLLGVGAMVVPNTASWGRDNLKGGHQIPQPSELYAFV